MVVVVLVVVAVVVVVMVVAAAIILLMMMTTTATMMMIVIVNTFPDAFGVPSAGKISSLLPLDFGRPLHSLVVAGGKL